MHARIQQRQAVLLLVAILAPCCLLVVLAARMYRQESELVEKRAGGACVIRRDWSCSTGWKGSSWTSGHVRELEPRLDSFVQPRWRPDGKAILAQGTSLRPHPDKVGCDS